MEGGKGVSAIKVLVRQMGMPSLLINSWTDLLKFPSNQIANALTLVLVAAMALSYGVQDWIEGATITAVVVLNITIGFFQVRHPVV